MWNFEIFAQQILTWKKSGDRYTDQAIAEPERQLSKPAGFLGL